MRSLIFVLLLMLMTVPSALAADGAIETIATRLDGSMVVGELTSWDGEALTITAKGEPVLLSAADLLAIRWSPGENSEPATNKGALIPSVELVDGTVLPVEEFERKAKIATLSLRELPEASKNVHMSDRLVEAVLLQPLAGSAAKQWEEICEQKIPSDELVIVKRSGESVDYIEGTIGDISAERVEFKLDGEMRRVERSKVAGVIFYRAARTPEIEPLCIVHGRDGLRASVKGASLRNGMVEMSTAAGAKFAWPVEELESVDFSGGKVVFLSDLEPASEERTSLVGLPASAALAAAYGRPRRDQSAFGSPLSLWFPERDSLAPVGHAQTFARGLAVRSRTELEYRVPRGFTRLLGVAGIEPATRANGAARLTISVDGRTLSNEELAGDKSPVDLELNIAGAKRVTIVVDYGKNLDTGDWVNLCDLRMVK